MAWLTYLVGKKEEGWEYRDLKKDFIYAMVGGLITFYVLFYPIFLFLGPPDIYPALLITAVLMVPMAMILLPLKMKQRNIDGKIWVKTYRDIPIEIIKINTEKALNKLHMPHTITEKQKHNWLPSDYLFSLNRVEISINRDSVIKNVVLFIKYFQDSDEPIVLQIRSEINQFLM